VKNYTTPRTLSECEFTTGHASVTLPARQSLAGGALAVVLGVALACAIVYGWPL
jgi:hypothetical protein